MGSLPCWEKGVLGTPLSIEPITFSQKHTHIVLRNKFEIHLRKTYLW